MSPTREEIVALKWEGLTCPEIAGKVGLSLRTVKRRVREAKAAGADIPRLAHVRPCPCGAKRPPEAIGVDGWRCDVCAAKYRERERERARRKAATTPPHIRRQEGRRALLWTRYRMTPEEFDGLWRRAGGRCENPACRAELHLGTLAATRCNIDHDHDTGRVLGLLCTKCNTAKGMLQDDANLMGRAALYVEAHQ